LSWEWKWQYCGSILRGYIWRKRNPASFPSLFRFFYSSSQ
jgi:hypothetical protein